MATSKSQRNESLARLHEILKPGDTVHTILRHVSRSGMMREISVIDEARAMWNRYPSLPKYVCEMALADPYTDLWS